MSFVVIKSHIEAAIPETLTSLPKEKDLQINKIVTAEPIVTKSAGSTPRNRKE